MEYEEYFLDMRMRLGQKLQIIHERWGSIYQKWQILAS